VKGFRPERRTSFTGMLIAAMTCAIVALAVIVNIEAWRRREVAQLQLESRRQAARERAWDAVSTLDADA
jgi:hypothetical protein